MATEARDAAIRDAKRYVREIVRNDWVFELSSEPGVPSFSSPPTPDQDVLRWRQREYDSSGSELEPQPSPAISPVGGHNASELASPLGTPLSDDSERRRKRRRQMEEEMQWNAGLRTWVERRDAWSGALSRDAIRAREARTQQAATPTTSSSEQQPPHNASVPAATTVATPPLSASSANSQNDLALRTEASLSIAENDSALPRPPSRGEEPSTAAEQPPPPPPAGEDENQGGESSSSADTGLSQPDSAHQQSTSEDPFIPVVSSLISNDNPIRASITPAMYPSIYSKVVIQGLTPTVPINLADITKAMVQGWKSDGQWPPKPSSIVLQDTATVRPKPEEPADKPPSSPESKRRSGVASAVRKVFHFSGFHPHHPFHRRGSSSQQNEGNPEGGVNQ